MRVLDPGHMYLLQQLDDTARVEPNDSLVFVKRMGDNYPGNKSAYPGTIIQDVLRCCIDRLKYVDKQVHCDLNWVCIQLLRQVIFLLELRAAQRHGKQELPRIGFNIEELPTMDNGHLAAWQNGEQQ